MPYCCVFCQVLVDKFSLVVDRIEGELADKFSLVVGRIEVETLVAQTLGADMDAVVVVVVWAVVVGSPSAEVGDFGVISSSNDSSSLLVVAAALSLAFFFALFLASSSLCATYQ